MREKPAGSAGRGSDVGNETKANVMAAGVGGGNPLKQATVELQKQHPQKHDDLGPHHGGMEHVRHVAMGGMRPKGA